MQKKDQIIELLEKIIKDQATNQEKEELFQLINSEKHKEKIFEWLEEEWKNTAPDNISIASKSILDKIHQQIGTIDRSDNSVKKSKIRRLINTTLKYAAIAVIACGIEWFFLTKQEGNRNTVQTNQYNEISVPAGSKSYIVLSDSTKVWLNAGARFRYPGNFQKNMRKVYLEGEAYFEVSKNKARPFFVDIQGMDIKVLGTEFNVKAYNDEKSIEATLVEGSIEVVGLKSDRDDEKDLRLKPGQKLILIKEDESERQNPNQGKQSPVKIKNAEIVTLHDTEPEISWKEDKLIFYKEKFENVKIRLERWYGVTIDIQDPQVLDYRFTGTFEEETLEQALQALQKAAKFDYQIKKKHIIIKRNS